MAYNFQDRLAGISAASEMEQAEPAIVNDSEPKEQPRYSYADRLREVGETSLQIDSPETVAGKVRESRKPKTWFGEFTNAFGRGVDSLQELGYGTLALGADFIGWDSARNFFVEKTKQQEQEMEQNPGSVESYEDVEGFDKGMRYFLGQLGQGAPQIIESVGTGIIGAGIGSATAPEAGTVIGGISGLIGRKAVKNIVKSGVDDVVKAELSSLAKGEIAKEALSETAKAVLKAESLNIAKKYGAVAALGANAWAMESSSIYTDLLKNPNVTESDRKIASLAGGAIAAVPDVFFEGWIASKFFKGVKNVGKEEIKQATNFVSRYAKTYGKELLKASPMESGQEFIQAVVEQASKDWAEFGPAKAMERIINPTPQQKRERIDSAFGGLALGVLGAGVSAIGELRSHPNPQVRAAEADVLQEAGDLTETLGIDDDDHRLAKIGELRTVLGQELAAATDDAVKRDIETKLGQLNTEELEIKTRIGIVNDNTEGEAEKVLTPAEQAIEDLRQQLIEKKPTGNKTFEATPEQRESVRQEITSFVESIAPATPEGQRYKEAVARNLLNENTLNMLAAEGVIVTTNENSDSKNVRESEGFQVAINDNGKIELVVPKYENLASKNTPQEKADYISNMDKLFGHEIIHVADVAAQRDVFDADENIRKTHGTLANYSGHIDATRGKALRDWWDGLTAKEQEGFPGIARQLRKAYEPGEPGNAADHQLSGEVPRMMVELARTGQLFETTEALFEAQRQAATPEAQGRISKWLKVWIDSIKNIHKTLLKLLDFNTAPASIVDAFNQIQRVMDKYGILVNDTEATEGETKTEAKKETKKKEEPGKTGEGKAPREDEPPIKPGMVRFYHGGVKGEGGRWISGSREYAEGYARKSGGVVQYIDVPKTQPELRKRFDDEGLPYEAPYAHIEATDEMMKGAKELPFMEEESGVTESDLTVGEAMQVNAKVEFEGERGRIVNDEGTFVLRTTKADFLLPNLTNESTSLTELGIRVLRATKAKENIRAAQQELESATPEEQAKEEEAIVNDTKGEPRFYQQASEHPLLNQLSDLVELGQTKISPRHKKLVESTPEYQRMVNEVTDEQLNRAENIIVNTLDQIEKAGLDPAMAEPFQELWSGIETLREMKREAKAKQESARLAAMQEMEEQQNESEQNGEVSEILPAARNEAEQAASNEGQTKQGKEKVKSAYQNFQSELKSAKVNPEKVADAQRAHYEWKKDTMTVDEAARDFKERFGRGVTLAGYKRAIVNDNPAMPKRAPVRLYRGETNIEPTKVPDWLKDSEEYQATVDATGRWFSDNIEAAQYYVDTFGSGDGRITYIDVPAEDVEKYRASNLPAGKFSAVGRAEEEFFVPRELADQRQSIVNDTAAKPKRAIKVSPRSQAKFRRFAREAAEQTRQMVDNLKEGRSTTKERRTALDFDKFSPALMEYATAPHTESARKAHEIVDKVGVLNVIETLIEDKEGKSLGIKEDAELNATLAALYELALTHLNYIKEQSEDLPVKDRVIVNDTFRDLEEQLRKMKTGAGQFNAFTHKVLQFMNGDTARREYVEPILAHAQKIFGKDAKAAKAAMEDLATKLNDAIADHLGGETSKAEMIALIRKIHKQAHSLEWRREVKKGIAADKKKSRKVTKRGSARAAEHQALDESGEAYVKKLIARMISEMNTTPKDVSSLTEEELFAKIVGKMARDAAKESGLIKERPGKSQETMEKNFAVILKNDTLYAQFVNQMHDTFVEEYGGESPSEDFLNEADLFRARLANRWTGDMVDALVNEKMRQHGIKFSKIVQDTYGRGVFEKEKVRNQIVDYMRSEGVTNNDLIDAIVNDIEASFDEQIEEAREKFFGQTKQVNDALKFYGTKLTELAKEHASLGDNYGENFEKFLEKEYGIPNTIAMPLARQIAQVMQQTVNKRLNGYTDAKGKYHKGIRDTIVERWINDTIKDPAKKKQALQSVEKILQLSNLGVMKTEKVYRALQEKFDLPPFKPEVADQIQAMGDAIAQTSDERTKNQLTQELANFLAAQKGISTMDMLISGFYFSILSGPSTHAVNVVSNASILAGNLITQAVKSPRNIGRMIRAMVRSAVGVGQLEMREAFIEGTTLGKQGNKFFQGADALEQASPTFVSPFKNKALKAIDEGVSKFVHKMIRGVKGNYIGRALRAADMFFYKVNEEVSYTSRMKDAALGTATMWNSALVDARREVEAQGLNPDTNRDDNRKMKLMAHDRYNAMRIATDEQKAAWNESHAEAMDLTLMQEPKGILGAMANGIEKITRDRPLGKLLVPFTRVAANFTNHALEWTPYGLGRYFFSKDFRIEKLVDGEKVSSRNHDIALRAFLGTVFMFGFLSKLADQDEDDPEIAVYADGPRDINEKRQLMERGWKPFTLKVGNHYFSYIYTPVGMAMSLIGGIFDDYRDGRIDKPSASNVNFASVASAMLRVTTEQSFLAGIADIVKATDSPDPVGKISKVFARTASSFIIPNFVKQLDKWIDPSIQQSNGLWESFLKEIPVIRSSKLKSALNVFGEEVHRAGSVVNLPGAERFVTTDPGTDPVLNMLGERRLFVPGFSKSTKLHDRKMTEDQYYEYVKEAGPIIKKNIAAELLRLRSMDKEEAKDRIEDIANSAKRSARAKLEAKYR